MPGNPPSDLAISLAPPEPSAYLNATKKARLKPPDQIDPQISEMDIEDNEMASGDQQIPAQSLDRMKVTCNPPDLTHSIYSEGTTLRQNRILTGHRGWLNTDADHNHRDRRNKMLRPKRKKTTGSRFEALSGNNFNKGKNPIPIMKDGGNQGSMTNLTARALRNIVVRPLSLNNAVAPTLMLSPNVNIHERNSPYVIRNKGPKPKVKGLGGVSIREAMAEVVTNIHKIDLRSRLAMLWKILPCAVVRSVPLPVLMDFTLMTWNCQGFGGTKFPRILKEYTQEHKPHMVALLETRVSGLKADQVIVKSGLNKSFRVGAVGFSEGIWLIVYGSPDRKKHMNLWRDLSDSHDSDDDPWILAGDFNVIISNEEKREGARRGKGCKDFQRFLNDHQLKELGFKGPPFTLTRGGIFERLDRIVANDGWFKLAPKCTDGPNTPNLASSLLIIGDIQRKLKRQLANIQTNMDRSGNSHLDDKEVEVCMKLEKILDHEEYLWRQKLEVIGSLMVTGIPSSFIVEPLTGEKKALLDMNPLKASGKDGLPVLFFQNQWVIVKGRIIIDNILVAQEAIHSMRRKKAVTTSSMQILLNGTLTNEFKPTRGIRQGCPLSPCLFVLCIERLDQSIHYAMENNLWEPMIMSRVPRNAALHSRVTKSTFQFIIDRVERKLSGWTASKLCLAGQIILAKSIFLAVPNYFMQNVAISKDGRTTRFWDDSWINDMGPLVDIIPVSQVTNPKAVVSGLLPIWGIGTCLSFTKSFPKKLSKEFSTGHHGGWLLPICGESDESILHVLRMDTPEFKWKHLFGALIWRLWKNRNCFVFNGQVWAAMSTLLSAKAWACTMKESYNSRPPRHPSHNNINRWTAPEPGTIKINTDGSVHPVTMRAMLEA
ncbi:hypothetical protein F3Y22_tig00110483pilonHSYRG00358 [Hibiscus syriacus]|uniref:Endonuclease/exonuclease/phosphatase domain-containing protein n=1 Tax=Hibiscus syriacus TaxID=106335 RepID=A0A6A3AF78_HIBSY|nr:hypothetical protein F3Y22_tig00110483pilonHSYRG00358 [Hibiscus syriacus]